MIIDTFKEGDVSQFWIFKKNYFFNQKKALDVPESSDKPGEQLVTYQRHGGDYLLLFPIIGTFLYLKNNTIELHF